MTGQPDYAAEVARSKPVSGGCYDCDQKWSGDTSRAEALKHADTEKHSVWIEGKPE